MKKPVVFCANAATLNTVAQNLKAHGQPYRFIERKNPVTGLSSPAIELPEPVFSAVYGGSRIVRR